MGYKTRYEIQSDDGISFHHEKSIETSMGFNPFQDNCKWYDHEIDMLAYSNKNQNVLFTLRGEGEENSDIWVKYFKNGKMQECRAKFTFDAFDESKLE